MSRLTVVAPAFNEGQTLEPFVQLVSASLLKIKKTSPELELTLILIDDGSADNTWSKIAELREGSHDLPIIGLKFSRNFGHQAAICAGLDYIAQHLHLKDNDTIIVMDSDGQHPPFHIADLVKARLEGFHHVQMIRENDIGSLSKRLISPIFYRLFRYLSGIQMPRGAADFRAFSGVFLKQYLKFNESVRFNRGLFHWLGFKTHSIPYSASPRIAGVTSYTLLRMIKFAFEGITYFSSKPLILSIAATTLIGFLFCGIYGIFEVIRLLLGASFVQGWPTIVFVVTLWGSLLSLGQLLLAFYVARIFDETKQRPIYILEELADDLQTADQRIASKEDIPRLVNPSSHPLRRTP